MFQTAKAYVIAVLVCAAVSVPSTPVLSAPNGDRLAEISSMRGKGDVKLSKEMEQLRPRALRETAEKIGVQEAFRKRYGELQAKCQEQRTSLDRMFNFQPLLLHGGHVIPPVVVSADKYTDISKVDEMVMVGNSYRILKPARFVSVPPSWRDYLLLADNALDVEEPHPAMLPMSSKEVDIWKSGVYEGWKTGMEHADRLFERSLNELKRDFTGLMQYKILSLKGFISVPMISEGHYAVKVGSDTLEFDQQTFRITEPSSFKSRDKWK